MTRHLSLAGLLLIGVTAAGYLVLRPEPVSARHVPITTKIVFNREIAQIFQKKCFQCHTDGNVSVPLTTYKEARPWAVAIKEEILERKMPPWGAAQGFGHFSNDMSLTGREISLILSWADGGAPSGVLLVDEDKAPVFIPPLNGWVQGPPDEVINVAADKTIAADSPYRVERFEVPTGLKQAKWLRSLQFNPGDRRAIRFAAAYDARGRWLGTWSPGSQVSTMPAGTGVQLPANGKITVEIGYRGNSEDAPGSTELGLYFAEKPPAQSMQGLEIVSPAVNLAAGKNGERIRSESTLKTALDVSAIWPRLGVGARSLEVTAMRPDGSVEPMLWVNNYRPEWPVSYIMKDAVSLPAGSRIAMTAYYDNKTDAALAARPSVALTAQPPAARSAAKPTLP